MHIGIFLPSLACGGAERSFLKIGGGIADRGHQVDLVLARKDGQFLNEIPETIQVIDLGSKRDITSLPKLIRYLRREQPDALLTGLHTNVIAIWAKYLACVSTIVIISERNTISQRASHYSSDIRMRILPFLIRTFYPLANSILAVSESVADDLSQFSGISRDRIQVIYNPIITPELKAKALAPLNHLWFAPGETPVILAVGRLTAQKDLSTLIKAFALVKKVTPTRLLILGEGDERELLEDLISTLDLRNDVYLPGFVANPYPYMTRAAVFVLPSKWEGLPGVLIEAAYCGATLVATDCPGGSREILGNGKYGRLVPVGDEKALAKAILVALESKLSPPKPCWCPFEQEYITDQYTQLLEGILTNLP